MVIVATNAIRRKATNKANNRRLRWFPECWGILREFFRCFGQDNLISLPTPNQCKIFTTQNWTDTPHNEHHQLQLFPWKPLVCVYLSRSKISSDLPILLVSPSILFITFNSTDPVDPNWTPIGKRTLFKDYLKHTWAKRSSIRKSVRKELDVDTYLTLPEPAAAVAKDLLNMKFLLTAVKALREAVLNILGRTIVDRSKPWFRCFTLERKKKGSPNVGSYMVFSHPRSPQALHTGRRTWLYGRWPMRTGRCGAGREALFHWAGGGYPALVLE